MASNTKNNPISQGGRCVPPLQEGIRRHRIHDTTSIVLLIILCSLTYVTFALFTIVSSALSTDFLFMYIKTNTSSSSCVCAYTHAMSNCMSIEHSPITEALEYVEALSNVQSPYTLLSEVLFQSELNL